MLRQAQHERKNTDELTISPFVLSMVEGLLMDFSEVVRDATKMRIEGGGSI
jgi:hypothetical protein